MCEGGAAVFLEEYQSTEELRDTITMDVGKLESAEFLVISIFT